MSRSERIPAALLLAAAVLALRPPPAPADPKPDLGPRLDTLFATLPHARFEWAKARGVSDRAAIRLPVDVDGTGGWFQLDTGLDVSLIYGALPEKRGWENYGGMARVPNFDIGDMHLGPTWMHTRPDHEASKHTLGSVGMDLLVGTWLLIDYPRRRIARMNPGDAPLWLQSRTSWGAAELRDGKFFVNVSLGGHGVEDIFFDTGASAYDITVDFDLWTELTGRSSPEEATVRHVVSSWGRKVTMLGAPARGPLVVGAARIENPLVFTMEENPNLFAAWPFPAGGLVGNAPFWNDVVILDVGLRPRFGLVR